MVAKNTVRRYVVNHAVNFVKLKESSNPIFFRKDLFWFIHAHMFWDTIWFKYHDAGMEEEECIDSNIFNTKFHTVLGTDRISGIFHIRYPAGYKIQLPVMRIFCLPVTWIFDQNTVYFRISGQIFCIQTDLRPEILYPDRFKARYPVSGSLAPRPDILPNWYPGRPYTISYLFKKKERKSMECYEGLFYILS